MRRKKFYNKKNNGKRVMVAESATMVNNIPSTGIYFDAKNGKFFASNEVVKMFAEHVVDKGENLIMILQNPKLLKNLGAAVKALGKQKEPEQEEA